jgi:hypothetical protein
MLPGIEGYCADDGVIGNADSVVEQDPYDLKDKADEAVDLIDPDRPHRELHSLIASKILLEYDERLLGDVGCEGGFSAKDGWSLEFVSIATG